jgi:hypothetical protein
MKIIRLILALAVMLFVVACNYYLDHLRFAL